MTVTVVVPHVPIRKRYLARAMTSIATQSQPADEIHVAIDNEHQGPAITRNRGLFSATSDYVLFLDDDDELEVNAIKRLTECANETGADVIYPWFTVNGKLGKDPRSNKMVYTSDPFPEMFGKPFNPAELESRNFIPITTLVRTELAKSVGGIPQPGDVDWPHKTNEDWGFWRRLLKVEAKFVHLPEHLWRWNIHHLEMPHYTGNVWS